MYDILAVCASIAPSWKNPREFEGWAADYAISEWKRIRDQLTGVYWFVLYADHDAAFRDDIMTLIDLCNTHVEMLELHNSIEIS